MEWGIAWNGLEQVDDKSEHAFFDCSSFCGYVAFLDHHAYLFPLPHIWIIKFQLNFSLITIIKWGQM